MYSNSNLLIGASIEDFKKFCEKNYKYDSSPIQASADHDNANQETPSHNIQPDRKLLERFWQWLTARDDVFVGSEKQGNCLSLGQVESLAATKGQQQTSSDTDKHDGRGDVRIHTTQRRVWQTVAGHDIDLKRLPILEFDALRLIASRGPEGILQPELVKVTGQDKRSVPKRTDALAAKSYIQKSRVIITGQKTSLLILKRYVDKGPPGSSRIFVGHRFQMNNFLDFLVSQVKPNESMMMDDLFSRIQCKAGTWERKTVNRSLDRLDIIGVIKRFRAPVKIDEKGETLVNTLQLQRVPTASDRKLWQTPTAQGRQAFRKRLETEHGLHASGEDSSEEDDKDSDVDREVSDTAVAGGVQQLVPATVARKKPQWDPDTCFSNLLYRHIDNAGSSGISTMQLRNQTFGVLYSRPLENMLSRLSDDWERSQPQNIQYMALIRDTNVSNRMMHYLYRSFNNFATAAEEGQAVWEAVRKPANSKNNSPAALDKFGFPVVAPKELCGGDGSASLTECSNTTFRSLKAKVNMHDHLLVHPDGHVTLEADARTRVPRRMKRMLEVQIELGGASQDQQQHVAHTRRELADVLPSTDLLTAGRHRNRRYVDEQGLEVDPEQIKEIQAAYQKEYQKKYREKKLLETAVAHRQRRIRAHAEWLAREEMAAKRERRQPARVVVELLQSQLVRTQTNSSGRVPAVLSTSEISQSADRDSALPSATQQRRGPSSSGSSASAAFKIRAQQFEKIILDRQRRGIHFDLPDFIASGSVVRSRGRKAFIATIRLPDALRKLDWFNEIESPHVQSPQGLGDGRTADIASPDKHVATPHEEEEELVQPAVIEHDDGTSPEEEAAHVEEIDSASEDAASGSVVASDSEGGGMTPVDMSNVKITVTRVKKKGRPTKNPNLIICFQSEMLPRLAPYLFDGISNPKPRTRRSGGKESIAVQEADASELDTSELDAPEPDASEPDASELDVADETPKDIAELMDFYSIQLFNAAEQSLTGGQPSSLSRNPFSVSNAPRASSPFRGFGKRGRKRAASQNSLPRKKVKATHSLRNRDSEFNIEEMAAAILYPTVISPAKSQNASKPNVDSMISTDQPQAVQRPHTAPDVSNQTGNLETVLDQIAPGVSPDPPVLDGLATNLPTNPTNDNAIDGRKGRLVPKTRQPAIPGPRRQKEYRKKQGVGLGMGSLAAIRGMLVAEIVAKAGGAFGGDSEILRPFQEAWAARNPDNKSLVDRDTVSKSIKWAVEHGKLNRPPFSFEDKNKNIVKRHLLLMPDLPVDSDVARKLREDIAAAYPSLFIPDIIRMGISPNKERRQYSRYKTINEEAVVMPPDARWLQEFQVKMRQAKERCIERSRLAAELSKSRRPIFRRRLAERDRGLVRKRNVRRLELRRGPDAGDARAASRLLSRNALRLSHAQSAAAKRSQLNEGKPLHNPFSSEAIISINNLPKLVFSEEQITRSLAGLTAEQCDALDRLFSDIISSKDSSLSHLALASTMPASKRGKKSTNRSTHSSPLSKVVDWSASDTDQASQSRPKKATRPGQSVFRGIDYTRSPSRRGRRGSQSSGSSRSSSVISISSDFDSLTSDDLVSSPTEPTTTTRNNGQSLSPAQLSGRSPVFEIGPAGLINVNSPPRTPRAPAIRHYDDYAKDQTSQFSWRIYKPERYDEDFKRSERQERLLHASQVFDSDNDTSPTKFKSKKQFEWNLLPLPKVSSEFRNVFSNNPHHIAMLESIDDEIDHNSYIPSEFGKQRGLKFDHSIDLLVKQCEEDFQEYQTWTKDGYDMQMHPPKQHGNRVFVSYDLVHEQTTATKVGQRINSNWFEPGEHFTMYGQYPPRSVSSTARRSEGPMPTKLTRSMTAGGPVKDSNTEQDDGMADVQPFEDVMTLGLSFITPNGPARGSETIFTADGLLTVPQHPVRKFRQPIFKPPGRASRAYANGRQPLGDPNCVINPAAAKRLLFTCILSKTLAGVRLNPIYWPAVEKVFSDYPNFDLLVFKKRWAVFSRFHGDFVQRMAESCQNSFLAAYEKDEVPTFDPIHPEKYDWVTLVDWAEENVLLCSTHHELPTNISDFSRVYEIQLSETSHTDDQTKEEMYRDVSTTVFRISGHHDLDFSVPAKQKVASKSPDDSEIELAKSWVRAAVATPEEQYVGQSAWEKLTALDDRVVNRAIDELHKDKVIAHSFGGHFKPGRNYHLGEAFFDVDTGKKVKASKVFGRALSRKDFVDAVAFKEQLDRQLKEQGTAPIPEMTGTGHMVVLCGLLASGQIQLQPRGFTIDSRLGAPARSISKWGFTPGRYQSKGGDRRIFHFAMEVSATPLYVYGRSNPERLTIPKPLLPPGDAPGRERLPFWTGIGGDFIKDAWDRTVAGVLHCTALRGGVTVPSMARAFKGFLREWEIRMVVEWLADVGVVRWERERDGVVTAAEHWWSAVDI